MLVPAAVGAGVGYLRAPKAKKGEGAVKGALWGLGIGLALLILTGAVAQFVSKNDELGLFKPQQGGTL